MINLLSNVTILAPIPGGISGSSAVNTRMEREDLNIAGAYRDKRIDSRNRSEEEMGAGSKVNKMYGLPESALFGRG